MANNDGSGVYNTISFYLVQMLVPGASSTNDDDDNDGRIRLKWSAEIRAQGMDGGDGNWLRHPITQQLK